TRFSRDWSSDMCSSDLRAAREILGVAAPGDRQDVIGIAGLAQDNPPGLAERALETGGAAVLVGQLAQRDAGSLRREVAREAREQGFARSIAGGEFGPGECIPVAQPLETAGAADQREGKRFRALAGQRDERALARPLEQGKPFGPRERAAPRERQTLQNVNCVVIADCRHY